ncbi:MAG: hypothetical protein ACLFTQ_03855 [Candidatus Aenigmatarchaeota archaeon]
MPEEFTCPECGNTFDTKRGLHVHQSQMHGEEDPQEAGEGGEGEKDKETELQNPFQDPLSFLNPWKWGVVLLAVILLINIYFSGLLGSCITGEFTRSGTLGSDEVGEKAVSFINSEMIQQGEAQLNSINETNGLYQLNLEIEDQSFESYATKDGELLFPQGVELTDTSQSEDEGTDEPNSDIVKSETPTANAFIMSYCPYGLQFLKAYIPVMELLGDEADLQVNFVDYAMHGKKELDENLRMYCVQKEEPEKFTDYLRCSVETEDENKEQCYEEAGVDEEAVKTCVQETDEEYNVTELYRDESTWSGGRYPLFPVESDLNDEYDVQGSPTFILNGKQVEAGRTPEDIKEAVCSAFETKPKECDQELSTGAAEAGLGPVDSESGTDTTAQC